MVNDADACQMHDGLMVSNGIWRGLDHVTTGIEQQNNVSIMLDGVRIRVNEGGRLWATSKDVDG
jgi:hypothetical protein